MRRYIGIVFLCVAVMVALLGCDRAEESAEKVYIAYLEACKVSAEAPLPYCHYEHEILRGYAADWRGAIDRHLSHSGAEQNQ